MTTTTSESVATGPGRVERKPLMTGRAILMMNLGFFGVQFSFGLTQSAVNPLFLLIGAKPEQLPILNLSGPVTGLIIQPLIGAISDWTWHPRWGRRRPFVTAGAILCSIILLAFPFVGVLWLGVICFWLLDAGNNTSMEPYRAFISDRLPKSQLARGFLTQSMFTGAGAVLANVSLFLLQKVSALDKTAGNGVPYWMYVCFLIGTVCILLTVLTAMARTRELTPSDEDLAEIRSAPKGFTNAIRDIRDAVKTMPIAMHKIGVVFVFQWYAMFIYWQFLAVSLGETVFHATPQQGGPAWDSTIAWSGLMNGAYNFLTMVSALFLVGFARRIGCKPVHRPDEAQESPSVPLGSPRSITVSDGVVVGSDGTPTSLYAVDRAAEVAQAAQAKLVVVTAYRDGDGSTPSTTVEGIHRDIYGAEAARSALEKSVAGLTRERARYVEQRLVRADPAPARLGT